MNLKRLSLKDYQTINIIFNYFIKLNIFLIFLFARTYTGVTIFGYRIGELLIGISLIFLIFFAVISPLFLKTYFLNNKSINFLILLLLISFIFLNIYNQNEFSNPFIYQTSSYIWSIGAILLGFYITKFINFKILYTDISISLSGLFIIYLYSTKGISENRQNFLLQFSDKFEYPKGSDILLAFIFIFYFLTKKLDFSKKSLYIFLVFTALFIPLFLVKSRSGFFSIIFFSIILMIKYKSNIKKIDYKIFFVFIISIFVFLISTSWVVGRELVIDEEIDDELKYAITSRYQGINDNLYESEVLKLKLFYFENGRLFSSDGNLNWRFQIWQDILSDMINSNNLFFGYGFDKIIPAMNVEDRLGQDKQNINVHSYIFHILSRGGLFHLLIIIFLYFLIYNKFKRNNLSFDYFLITIPLIFNSLFDPSMENPHYPVILYFLLGLALNNSIIFNEVKTGKE